MMMILTTWRTSINQPLQILTTLARHSRSKLATTYHFTKHQKSKQACKMTKRSQKCWHLSCQLHQALSKGWNIQEQLGHLHDERMCSQYEGSSNQSSQLQACPGSKWQPKRIWVCDCKPVLHILWHIMCLTRERRPAPFIGIDRNEIVNSLRMHFAQIWEKRKQTGSPIHCIGFISGFDGTMLLKSFQVLHSSNVVDGDA